MKDPQVQSGHKEASEINEDREHIVEVARKIADHLPEAEKKPEDPAVKLPVE